MIISEVKGEIQMKAIFFSRLRKDVTFDPDFLPVTVFIICCVSF